MQEAGFEVAAAFDNWKEATDVYALNFQHPIFTANLREEEKIIPLIKGFAPQIIVGGPPCQDFSSAGKRNENNGRGDLTLTFARIVSAVKPEWFVMENVARIVRTQKLAEATNLFKNAGYGLSQTVLDASLCGVPQKRKRFVLIGRIGEKDGFIDSLLTQHLSEAPMTMAEYFGDKLDIQYYYRHPRSYARRGIFSIHEPSPTIRGVNRPLPANYRLHPGDPVATTDGIRPLTTKERSMVQTFPSGFRFQGSKTNVEQMIGNAVPVRLARYIGEQIQQFARSHTTS